MHTLKQLNSNKIHQIQQKLHFISHVKEHQAKDQAYERLLKKISSIENGINTQLKFEEGKIRQLREYLKIIQRQSAETLVRKQYSKQQRINNIEKIKRKLVHFFHLQVQVAISLIDKESRETQHKIITLANKRIQEINSEVYREIQERKQFFHQLDRQFCRVLPQTHEKIQKKLYESDRRLEVLEQKIKLQRQSVENKVRQIEKTQSESYESLMGMMGSIIEEMESQLIQEKEEREESKEKLMKLFSKSFEKFNPIN